jgi:hypothetical protein
VARPLGLLGYDDVLVSPLATEDDDQEKRGPSRVPATIVKDLSSRLNSIQFRRSKTNREERQSTLLTGHQITRGQSADGLLSMRLLASFFLPCTSLSAPEVVLGHQTLRRRQRICKAVWLRALLPSVSPPFRIKNNSLNKVSPAGGSEKSEN